VRLSPTASANHDAQAGLFRANAKQRTRFPITPRGLKCSRTTNPSLCPEEGAREEPGVGLHKLPGLTSPRPKPKSKSKSKPHNRRPKLKRKRMPSRSRNTRSPRSPIEHPESTHRSRLPRRLFPPRHANNSISSSSGKLVLSGNLPEYYHGMCLLSKSVQVKRPPTRVVPQPKP
jgi:hypothetical protein